MPKSKSRKKSYRPKLVAANSVGVAMSRASKVSVSALSALIDPVEDAYKALAQAQATSAEWSTIGNAINIGEALAILGIGSNLKKPMDDAQSAMFAVGLRYLDDGRMTCKGHELALIREALDMYFVQLRLCSQGELSDAVEYVNRRLKSQGSLNVSKTYAALKGVTRDPDMTALLKS